MNHWQIANLNLIAKTLTELHFEEVLVFDDLATGQHQLKLRSGVTYRFTGTPGAWNHLWVKPSSIQRLVGEEKTPASAAQFFIDAEHEIKVTKLTLANFLEEMHNTLYSDVQILKSVQPTSAELLAADGNRLHSVLSGHPKLLLNKGRMGWGAEDLAHYAPESATSFQLHWLLSKGSVRNWTLDQALTQSFSGGELTRMRKLVQDTIGTNTNFRLLPVHPWQWDHVVQPQFQSDLANGNLIDLGVGGDRYVPQMSLRTLSNADRPECHDIKLPLSILNTSCVRGLPQRYLDMASTVSQAMKELCAEDSFLRDLGVEVQHEPAAFGHAHTDFEQVKEAPYRYHEYLGAVWRESAASKLEAGQAIPAAALFHRDSEGMPLAAELITRSGLTPKAWITRYAKHVILPLYHLQLAHGVGLVAHGQNITVHMKGSAPAGLFLKDFHGDLRLSSDPHDAHGRYFAEVKDGLTRLPPEHLIHDLITGHFVTVLRFFSHSLAEAGIMSEAEFYQTMSGVISDYHQQHPNRVKTETDLLARDFQRVLVNRVRFKIGYGDSAERPLPILGSRLLNPLFPGASI